MKWGRRKASGPSSADHTVAAGLRKKKLHEMSNAELKTLTNRLQLEKSYKDLSRSKIDAGKKFAGTLLAGALTTALAPMAAAAIKKAIESTIATLTKPK
jgi:hypothetical protein